MRIQGYFKETCSFVVTTALSCGPSQLFGVIKLIVDACLVTSRFYRHHTLSCNQTFARTKWDLYKCDNAANRVKSKVSPSTDLDFSQVDKYYAAKLRKTEEKIKRLWRAIKADFCALIPLIGAHLSWRVGTDYQGEWYDFSAIFSKAVEQSLENHKKLASLPLFIGRKSKGANEFKDTTVSVDVVTSTKTRKLTCHFRYSENQEIDLSRPSVVLFHPNMGDGSVLGDEMTFFSERGYNTYAFTIGGYKGSPGVTTSEKSIYQDVEAIKFFLQGRGVTEVGYYGWSLGSGPALQAAVGETNANNLKTKFVVLDQPYTSVAAIGANLVGAIGEGFMNAACPIGLDVELPGGKVIKTDGLNNAEKVSELSKRGIPLFCCQRLQDWLMGRSRVQEDEDSYYSENFATDLLLSRYPNLNDLDPYLIILGGGHGPSVLGPIVFQAKWINPQNDKTGMELSCEYIGKLEKFIRDEKILLDESM